jgi:transketolase
MPANVDLDRRCVDTIRFLSVDAIENANSGHPGMPMGAATMAYVLWMRHLRHNPSDPGWLNRDRFILSAGHASSLLYVLLHLTGYDLPLSEIKAFRQWGSKTPGHPENTVTPGVEVTTGPLGQGIGNAVGEAIAEVHLAARYNRPGHTIVDHYTYAIAGDGDLMEGISAEACAIAGHLGLGKLIVLYDANSISLAGSTSLSFTEDVLKRFEAQDWHVQRVDDGHDIAALSEAFDAAKADTAHPSLIIVNTIIGDGAPHKQGTFDAHGAPLGAEELAAAKERAGWPVEPLFYIPEDVLTHFRSAIDRGKQWQGEWQQQFSAYGMEHPDLRAEFTRRMKGELPNGWDENLPAFPPDEVGLATRKASETVLQRMAAKIPELIGGSADLNPCTYTWLKGYGDLQSPTREPNGIQGAVGDAWGYAGRNLHYGVREHAMGAIANGMAGHGGFIPYTATFLPFADYMRAPIRLAALSRSRVVFVFTHDSIMVGEDGPTHQPIEQVMNLRAVPNLIVIRPADANEVSVAWRVAVQNATGPTALIFSRQKLSVFDRARYASAEGLTRGGYILWESSACTPDLIIIGTGSEVQLAVQAGEDLGVEGINVRVVSLPSWELFDRQTQEYRESILPKSVRARIAIEAGIVIGWEHYVGLDGTVVGMTGFGASAPGHVLYEHFGFTKENVITQAKKLLVQREQRERFRS